MTDKAKNEAQPVIDAIVLGDAQLLDHALQRLSTTLPDVFINTKSQAWDVTVTGRFGVGQKLQQVQDFLDRHEGFKSFLWTPPGGGQGRYTSSGYKLSTLGGGLHSLSTNLKQTFKP